MIVLTLILAMDGFVCFIVFVYYSWLLFGGLSPVPWIGFYLVAWRDDVAVSSMGIGQLNGQS